MKICLFIFLIIVVLQLVVCSKDEAMSNATDCSLTVNLLLNPEFHARISDPYPQDWRGSQHIGAVSFFVTVKDGALTIDKTGNEPWFLLTQKLNAAKLSLEAKVLQYTADIKLNLTDEGINHSFPVGGGLYLQIHGDSDPLIGDKLLYDGIMKHVPVLGETEWETVNVTFKVPSKAERITIGFIHQANGKMQVKNPSLRVCEK